LKARSDHGRTTSTTRCTWTDLRRSSESNRLIAATQICRSAWIAGWGAAFQGGYRVGDLRLDRYPITPAPMRPRGAPRVRMGQPPCPPRLRRPPSPVGARPGPSCAARPRAGVSRPPWAPSLAFSRQLSGERGPRPETAQKRAPVPQVVADAPSSSSTSLAGPVIGDRPQSPPVSSAHGAGTKVNS
jgi:hypothetical protein